MSLLANLGLGGLMGSANTATATASTHINAAAQYAQYQQSIANQVAGNLGQQSLYHQQLGNYGQNIANLGRPIQPLWMIDGRVMSMEKFADELFGVDTPERTMFLLKYSK